MIYTLTLAASGNPLDKFIIGEVLGTLGVREPQLDWLSQDYALDIIHDGITVQHLPTIRRICNPHRIDAFITNKTGRRKKLLIADMDSTIVTGETLDDLAAHAGIKDQIAEITTRAMNGELDFHAAIKERVGLLKGLSTEALAETLKETKLNEGAKTLVATMKAHGAFCVLVSGGFTVFTQSIAAQVGFDAHHGNTLGLSGEILSGEVTPPILDKDSKVEFLEHYLTHNTLTHAQAMSIGDGANDLPMLKACEEENGLGIGFYAKDSVAAQLTNMIRFGTLKTALYAQGYKDFEMKEG